VSEELAHDAHLRAALRHAPDHALSPPSGLSQTILSAARQLHRPPVRATPAPPPARMRAAGPRPWIRWLRRLFAPRWAGAWAAGLVATLGLGLWLDLELQPVVDRPAVVTKGSEPLDAAAPAAQARAPTSSSQAAADDARVAMAKAAPSTLPDVAARAPVTPAPRSEAPAAEVRKAERAAPARSEVQAARSARDATASPPAEAPLRQDARPEPATAGAVRAAPAANDQPADTASAAPSVPATPPAPTAVQPNEQSAPAPGAAELRSKLARSEARLAEVAQAPAAASPALTLLRRAQAELASGSARWTWSAPGTATMAPLDDAAQAWLARAVQAARGRWTDVSERGEALDALEVRWWRDGWPHATLRIEAQGLRWIEPSGRIRYAPLDAATLRQLRTF
jgi:hypothetical protein